MAFVVFALLVIPNSVSVAGASSTRAHATSNRTITVVTCPWLSQARSHRVSAPVLAREVLARMTLHEKAAFVTLVMHPFIENYNDGIPSLCVPSLRLTDGPVGLADGLTGVTQFPSAIGVAASFDPSVARAIGRAIADEAKAKGFNVVQATELNVARVPLDGRIFETYGEDPYLTSVMGVANIEGVQSQGVMDMAKHLGAYTQETARLILNQVVTTRALQEVYLAPFRAAVEQAHVASMMCSYGSLNGVASCADPYLYGLLDSWGFRGFVRSDFHAVLPPAIPQAFFAGLSLVKPATVWVLVGLVRDGTFPLSSLNRAVLAVLTQMFRYGDFTHRRSGSLDARVTSSSHAAVALRAAERGIVLLKNSSYVLPLSTSVSSIAVIGVDAKQRPVVAGGGSSAVLAPSAVTPLSAITRTFGGSSSISFTSGGPTTLDLNQLSGVVDVHGTPLRLITPIRPRSAAGRSDFIIDTSPNVTPAIATATTPGTGEGWNKWRLEVRAKKTDTYEVAIQQCGDAWLRLNGHVIMASAGLHPCSDMATTVRLTANRTYRFAAEWFQVLGSPRPKFGLIDVTPAIDAAVAAARHARVAVIFVGDANSEGSDRPSLNLPGDSNALISAVASANPRTIVVLNTGGAVLMPWLSHVAGVLEAWYPGQVDGTAIAAALSGVVDPSGRLPITFPTSNATTPMRSASQYPGISSVVNFGSGLDVGYRWYLANHVKPLFPFGFGLSYTHFRWSRPHVERVNGGLRIGLHVTNVGARSGTDVVQVYVRYPSAAGEPPEMLRAFASVNLVASQSRDVSLFLPTSSFQSFLGGAFRTVPGNYVIGLGTSSENLVFHSVVRLT